MDTGTIHFVAANGDTLDATIVGSGMPSVTPDGIIFTITETCTITGGTGRFAGATGSFVAERMYDRIADTTIGSFEGTISSR